MFYFTHLWWWLQFLHPGRLTPTNPQTTTRGGAYWFYSGAPNLAIWPYLYWRHNNCHVGGCWRTGKIDPKTHHPACRKHHSHGHLLGVSHGA